MILRISEIKMNNSDESAPYSARLSDRGRLIVDLSLDKYDNVVLFPEKLAKANALLKKSWAAKVSRAKVASVSNKLLVPASTAADVVAIYASMNSGALAEDYAQHKPALGKVKLAEFAQEFAAAF